MRLVWVSFLAFWLCSFGHWVSADTVVIEARLDRPANDVAALLEPLRAELMSRGASALPGELARRLEAAGAPPARADAGLRLDFIEAIDRSYKLWISGSFAECLAALQPLLAEAHRSPADIAADSHLGSSVHKGLVTLALCQHRLGDERASRDTMLELLRSFELEVSKAQYGAEAVELFVRARAEAKAAASGALTVRSLDASAAIFINERFAGIGRFARAALSPGRYRVFAQVGTKQSRLHVVQIEPGENVSLELDAEQERSLTTAPWFGYSFEDREQRVRREQSYAARLGAALAASSVVVIGLDERDGRTYAYGAVIDAMEGKEVRRGSISMEPLASPQLQRALGRFLMGEPPAAGILVSGSAQPSVRGTSPTPGAAAPKLWPGWKWLAASGAIGGLGAGTTLLVLDGSCTTTAPRGAKCPDLRDYKVGGIISLSTGVAMAAVATWFFLREGDDDRSAFWAAPSDGGAMAGLLVSW